MLFLFVYYYIKCYICNVNITLKSNKMKTISNQRAERIARNINAMDLYYDYIEQQSKWRFWNDLRTKLFDILRELSNSDKEIIKTMCKEENAKYFGLT